MKSLASPDESLPHSHESKKNHKEEPSLKTISKAIKRWLHLRSGKRCGKLLHYDMIRELSR